MLSPPGAALGERGALALAVGWRRRHQGFKTVFVITGLGVFSIRGKEIVAIDLACC